MDVSYHHVSIGAIVNCETQQPITQREIDYPESAVFVSRTDLKGVMTDTPLSLLIEKAVQRGVAMALAQRPRPSFLTREQAAEILGVTPRTVTNMITDGRIRVGSSGKIAITEIDKQLTDR